MKIVKICKGRIEIPVATNDVENIPSLFVSPGEYPVYDPENYDFMQEDKVTEKAYISAIKKVVKGKNVIDIGCGRDMDWGMYALDYGAKTATGIEVQKSTFDLAQQELKGHIYEEDYTLINSLSTNFQPKEKFDICLSEIIGTIGGSEGVAVALKDAKERLLKIDGKILPYSCITKVAAVCLEDIIPEIAFHPDSIPYIEQLFELLGDCYPLRLTITHNEAVKDNLMTTEGIAETLNFEGEIKIEDNESSKLLVKKDGKINGLVLWVNLQVEKNGPIVDSLNQITSWEVVFIPCNEFEVKENDLIGINVSRELSDDKVHPNYHFMLNTTKNKTQLFSSLHHTKVEGNSFYNKLFKKV